MSCEPSLSHSQRVSYGCDIAKRERIAGHRRKQMCWMHGLRQLLLHEGCTSKLKMVFACYNKKKDCTARMETQKRNISLQRWIVFVAAGFALLLFVLHRTENLCVFLLGGLAFFFGVTDFGRRCPLFLSVQHLYARIQKKK